MRTPRLTAPPPDLSVQRRAARRTALRALRSSTIYNLNTSMGIRIRKANARVRLPVHAHKPASRPNTRWAQTAATNPRGISNASAPGSKHVPCTEASYSLATLATLAAVAALATLLIRDEEGGPA